MQEHIRIMAAGKPLVLPEDFSLDIEDVNPLFNDNVQSGSDPATLPLEGNRFLVKNLEDVNSDLRAIGLEHTDMQIYIQGMPYRSGELVISEDQEISDSFDFSINSYTQALSDLISDLECWDVPIKDQIQIGECIGDVFPDYTTQAETRIKLKKKIQEAYSDGPNWDLSKSEEIIDWTAYTDSAGQSQQYDGDPIETPTIGFSIPFKYAEADANHINVATNENGKIIEENYINTDKPYPLKPYCNARVAYANYKLDDEGKTSDDVDVNQPMRVLDATRPGSGLCFYVLYFFDCLFNYLGLNFDNRNLLKVEDMKRLAFYTTRCSYDTIRKYPLQDGEAERWDLNDITQINEWLEQRKSERIPVGKIDSAQPSYDWKDLDELYVTPQYSGMEGYMLYAFPEIFPTVYGDIYKVRPVYGDPLGQDPYEPHITVENFLLDKEFHSTGISDIEGVVNNSIWPDPYYNPAHFRIAFHPGFLRVGDYVPMVYRHEEEIIEGHTFNNFYCVPWRIEQIQTRAKEGSVSGTLRANIMKMYANSKNFPQTSVKNIIDSMWASFGVKFVYNQEERRVIPYFIRDILRNTAAPRRIRGTVLSVEKVAEKITGFRMQYAAESDPKEQSKNIRDGVRDYETAFDYIITQALNSKINSEKDYVQIRTETGGISNTTCYVDVNTGNAYRWKADKEAAENGLGKVSLFEVASYRGITKGDCSKKNEDFIEEAISNFEPVIFSNAKGGDSLTESLMVAYADVDMLNPEEVMTSVYAMGTKYVDIPVVLSVKAEECFDAAESDDGESPLQTYDWGNAIAVMRGGGNDAYTEYYDFNYDGQGNSHWRSVNGTYATTSDSIDVYKHDYDYNAEGEGTGTGERFSLKITAYKHDEQGNPLTDDQGNILCADDVRDPITGEVTLKIRSRGLFDTFMSDYAHFILNRKKLRIRMLCEVADLMDIPNHWGDRYQIGDYVGWINRLKSKITVATGLEEVEIELFAL